MLGMARQAEKADCSKTQRGAEFARVFVGKCLLEVLSEGKLFKIISFPSGIVAGGRR